MPEHWPTTIGLIIAAAITATAACIALLRLRRHPTGRTRRFERIAMTLVTLITAGLFVHHVIESGHGWAPLASHVDGLLLLATLLSGMIAYMHWTDRLSGLSMFATPLLVVLLLWGICASWWTFRLFAIEQVWDGTHLITVYIGAAALAVAAVAGLMYLYVQYLLRKRNTPHRTIHLLGGMASLESIERTIIVAASVGFVFITFGLATGLIVHTQRPDVLGPGWWHAPKVIGGTLVWLIYALVMHVRFAPVFRGRRAAVLSIIGFAILLAVLALTARMR